MEARGRVRGMRGSTSREANLIFVLPIERLRDPAVGGTFWFQIFIGNLSGNVHRSRHALNADTIREMHVAFRQVGREAIDKVMRNQPADLHSRPPADVRTAHQWPNSADTPLDQSLATPPRQSR